MSVSLKYQGRSYSNNRDMQEYTQTWQGFESQIDAKMGTLSGIGTYYSGRGYLTSVSKTPDEGPFWNLEIVYSTDYGNESFSNSSDTVVGRKSAQLSVRNLQLPLERLENYRTNWNYYLIGLCDEDDTLSTPDWWQTAGYEDLIPAADRKKYRWVKTVGEIPTEPEDGKTWQIIEKPTKPGVEYYDYAYFVVTISAKYKSARAAGNAIGSNINTIVTPAEDFNLGGEWKYDEASVQYDGKAWIATQVYTRAGDEEGWDQDIYPH